MRNIVYLIVVLALVGVVAPNAYAYEPDRDWAPSDPCGSIDPNRACYLTAGSGDCPPNNSYSNCLSRCQCQKDAAYKRCDENNGGLSCRSAADMNYRACKGECLSDWTP